MKRGRVYRSETLHKPSSVKACVWGFTRRKWKKRPIQKSLEITGVAERHQERDEETVKQTKNCRWIEDRHRRDLYFFFTSDVFGCYENTTCLDPPQVGIKALSVQCCYTFTYTNTLIQSAASSLLRQNRKTFWLRAPQSMKHEESLRH